MSDPKKGWVRKLTFLDGGCCTINRSDAGADEIFRYVKQYWEMQQIALQGRAAYRWIQPIGKNGLYYKLLYSVAAALVMTFFMMYQTI